MRFGPDSNHGVLIIENTEYDLISLGITLHQIERLEMINHLDRIDEIGLKKLNSNEIARRTYTFLLHPMILKNKGVYKQSLIAAIIGGTLALIGFVLYQNDISIHWVTQGSFTYGYYDNAMPGYFVGHIGLLLFLMAVYSLFKLKNVKE